MQTLVNLNEVQFGFVPGTVDAIFIVRKMQEESKEGQEVVYVFC